MEETQQLVKNYIKSGGKIMLILGIISPIISIAFLVWLATGDRGTIILPRFVFIILVFGVLLSPFFLYQFYKSLNPEKNGIYKILFIEKNLESMSIKKVYGSYNIGFKKTGSVMISTLTIKSQDDAEKLLDYIKQNFPNVQITK